MAIIRGYCGQRASIHCRASNGCSTSLAIGDVPAVVVPSAGRGSGADWCMRVLHGQVAVGAAHSCKMLCCAGTAYHLANATICFEHLTAGGLVGVEKPWVLAARRTSRSQAVPAQARQCQRYQHTRGVEPASSYKPHRRSQAPEHQHIAMKTLG